jgi:hypothetical protein
MEETPTLGAYLRAERERRELALKSISESTKVSLPLLEGLESDDISRWPGGIFRRAFVRSYAEAVGLDPDDVYRRFERQHGPAYPATTPLETAQPAAEVVAIAQANGGYRPAGGPSPRARYLGTAADMAVAMVLAFGSAAAGSRLLWPVILIAAYYAAGILLTGTSPMVALLGQVPQGSGSSKPPLGRVDQLERDADGVDTMLGQSPRTIS